MWDISNINLKIEHRMQVQTFFEVSLKNKPVKCAPLVGTIYTT